MLNMPSCIKSRGQSQVCFCAPCSLRPSYNATMPCGHCGRRFGELSALESHQKAKNHCYCRECDRFFPHPDSAEQHRSALHSFKCSDCNRNFVRPEALQQHQKSTGHCYCRECDRSFAHPDSAEQHRSALHSFKCSDCNRNFVRPEALQQHHKSTGHCYCRDCDRSFANADAVEQHRSALHSFTCSECDRNFVRLDALQRHQQSTKHCYCGQCDRFFVNPEALGQHLQSSIHATHFHCCDCDRDFVDEQALHQHLESKTHKSDTKSKLSPLGLSAWVCEECEREFKDEKGLEQHLLSVIHKPLSDFKCFGDRRCTKRFTSPSAWLHHLESGACRSKITRAKLNTAVQSSDISQLITGGSHQEYAILQGADVSGEVSTTGSVILTPVTGDGFDESPFWPASPASQSGMLTPGSESLQCLSATLPPAIKLLCPLCPIGRKPFKSLEALSNHLASPAHSPKLFHCPLSIAGYEDEGKISELMKYFSTLSGLLQHLESGACQGGNTTFRKTVEYIEHNLGKMGLQRLHLLN